jgi:hypothetical protein
VTGAVTTPAAGTGPTGLDADGRAFGHREGAPGAPGSAGRSRAADRSAGGGTGTTGVPLMTVLGVFPERDGHFHPLRTEHSHTGLSGGFRYPAPAAQPAASARHTDGSARRLAGSYYYQVRGDGKRAVFGTRF